MNFIFHPGEGRCDVSLGGKAKALAALHDEDLYIPDWFVVLPKAFTSSFSTVDRMTVLTNDSAANVEHLLSRFNPDPRFLSELNAALEVLCPVGESVAVRSSAIDEDGREHSFAGQLESYLNVQSEDVVAKVVAVWASAFSPRVRAYRKQHHLSGVPGPPAVLIQKMIQAECAGVAFGADPVSGRRDLAVVSAVAGLGTHLVNGESDADTWRVNTQGTIVERQK